MTSLPRKRESRATERSLDSGSALRAIRNDENEGTGAKTDVQADNKPKLLIIEGDGIGPEVIREARRVVDWFADSRNLAFDISESRLGVRAYYELGAMLPDETLRGAEAADAVLFGAIGGDGYEEIPIEVRP